ncbi:MAG: diguanylate cyclase/phosphodiesterase with and sensor(s) [Dehalococcoidia bacterium]|nr:diguanylate cyclase/phosphodiesterase with and sensor(s) [Dehalococcoidia bacterium]
MAPAEPQGNQNESTLSDELKFRTVAEAVIDAVILADTSGKIISWNPGAEAIFGHTEAEVLGQPLTILMPERHQAAHLRGLERVSQTGERQRIGRTSEVSGLRKDGQEFPIELSLGTWVTSEGRFFCGIIRDVTERTVLQEALRHAALHDPLTHLPNRTLCEEELRRAAAQAVRTDRCTGVLVVDLDDFKMVNDSFGHLVGDTMLKSAGERLRSAVREGDIIARLGGDEFVVLLENLLSEMDALVVAERMVASAEEPLTVDDHTIRITASVGVATRRGRFAPEDILRAADTALYVAKKEGKARFAVAPAYESG